MVRTGMVLAAVFFLATVQAYGNDTSTKLPEGFVYVEKMIPSLVLELHYITNENFIGRPIDGYEAPRCILTREAAEAVAAVQERLRPFGLGLKVFDAYRPQRAVDHFVRWAKDPDDILRKAEYYPDIAKNRLFPEGYIAERSSHSRGSTVDLTIVSIRPETMGRELDMGTGFDFFGPESAPLFPGISDEQRAHRLLLQTLMVQHGFAPYAEEWWHFTLKDESFPNTYFDFPVR
ncbi:MAG: peptidase M15 [Deltaproteobacteria bacterium]|nr:peptidase M15 [Deltaproteobacteria bacterium]